MTPLSSPRTSVPAEPPAGEFLLVACQPGAEAAITARQVALLPDLRRGAWRRGLVTFRLAPGRPRSPAAVRSMLAFARTCIHSLGQVTAPAPDALARRIIALAGPADWGGVHVWDRAGTATGPASNTTPGSGTASAPGRDDLRCALVAGLGLDALAATPPPGAVVLDCVLDSAERAWVGWHRVDAPVAAWPGGIYPGTLPAHAVSRAWLKLDEAIAAFGLDLRRSDRAVELGCAPGGASQRLLEAGLRVVGVDPAEVDPVVAAHERFEQWRRRARDVRLREFRPFDWIVADMNIDPASTMEALGRIATAPNVRPRGIVATLKLPNWARAAELAEWLGRFREWGFAAEARQLSTAGREVCVVARRERITPRRPPAATRRRAR